MKGQPFPGTHSQASLSSSHHHHSVYEQIERQSKSQRPHKTRSFSRLPQDHARSPSRVSTSSLHPAPFASDLQLKARSSQESSMAQQYAGGLKPSMEKARGLKLFKNGNSESNGNTPERHSRAPSIVGSIMVGQGGHADLVTEDVSLFIDLASERASSLADLHFVPLLPLLSPSHLSLGRRRSFTRLRRSHALGSNDEGVLDTRPTEDLRGASRTQFRWLPVLGILLIFRPLRCTTSKRSFVQARSPRPPPRATISLNPPCDPPPVPSHSPSLSAETAMKFQNRCLPHPLARAAETAASPESYLAVAARAPMVPA